MTIKKGIALILCIVMIIAAVFAVRGVLNKNNGGAYDDADTGTSNLINVGSTSNEFIALDNPPITDGMEKIAESNRILLYLDKTNANLRLIMKETGDYMDTKIFNGVNGNETIKNTQKSDLRFTYMSTTRGNSRITLSTMDDYTLSVMLEGVTYETIDQGIRIKYEIGDTRITYNDFPLYITEERMKEFVISHLNSTQVQLLTSTYYRLSQGVYVRKSNDTKPLGKLAANELFAMFYENGTYTKEELEADNLANDVVITSANAHISAALEYVLQGDDLVVRIPVSEIIAQEQYPIQSIDVLPYFLSGSTGDVGYFFVPDGSGAVINFNNNKTSEFAYSSRYYGGDKLISSDTYKENTQSLNLPVFGMKKKDFAVLGIIEGGAGVANVNVSVSGMSDEFNKLGLNFILRDIDNISPSNVSNYTMPKYSEDAYNSDIIIRYRFLTGENADYSGMAKAYQNYLVDQGILVKQESEAQAPIYVELLGAVNKKKFILGIPYTTSEALTTFDEAKEIIKSLNENNITNIKLLYTGITNGGLNQSAVKSVQILSSLGGKKGLKELNTYVQEHGAMLYPNFRLQTSVTKKGISNSMRPQTLGGAFAEIYDFDLVTREAIKNNKYPTIIIAAKSLPSYIDQFASSYSALGIPQLASCDLADFVAADYRKGHNVSMEHSWKYYDEVLSRLTEDYELMLSNPMAAAYRNVSRITDLPASSNRYKLIDYDIPFVQLVLNGYINYSVPAVNMQGLTIRKEIMQAIEADSSLKFRFTYEGTKALSNSDYENELLTQYSIWKDSVGAYYKEYNDFYQKVKDAQMIKHRVVDGNYDLRVVTYSNGVCVYLNYGSTAETIAGVTVEPLSYVVK
ncbi:MAG TPA: DUF5696 domain-containing protein [Mobilitalea sp.]|nr:DUF5696 domain-containing protein [Mobilitalea sp.]